MLRISSLLRESTKKEAAAGAVSSVAALGWLARNVLPSCKSRSLSADWRWIHRRLFLTKASISDMCSLRAVLRASLMS